MIIKGDLDRMAEDIGHAGKSQRACDADRDAQDDVWV